MRILIAGPKASGKTTVGRLTAGKIGIDFVETDNIIEEIYAGETGKRLSFREIYKELGKEKFRELESRAVDKAASRDWCVISTGGSTLNCAQNRRKLRRDSIVILLNASIDELWERASRDGLPAFLTEDDPKAQFEAHVSRQIEAVEHIADRVIDISGKTPDECAEAAIEEIQDELAFRTGDPNTLGEIIRVTTFGESHGPAIGAVLDGVPPGLPLSNEDVQKDLDRRRPGQSSATTPRSESDTVRILSGVFDGKTTGAPICMLIENKDQDSSKYEAFREMFRPGHADLTYWQKFGIRDHRGGGRSSGRETAGRVCGGAVAKKILAERGVKILAYSIEIAGIKAENRDLSFIEQNPVRTIDPANAQRMFDAVVAAKDRGESVGGMVELLILGVPPGLGDPVFGKLDALLGRAILSLGAVKGIEIGEGFAHAKMIGSESNDQMRSGAFVTNNAGGIHGGISNGQDIVMRLGVKPTPSVSVVQQTIDLNGKDCDIKVEGRHDPCIIPRIIPVVESMAALVILDAWEVQSRLRPDWQERLVK